jgi:hypothetical protein
MKAEGFANLSRPVLVDCLSTLTQAGPCDAIFDTRNAEDRSALTTSSSGAS